MNSWLFLTASVGASLFSFCGPTHFVKVFVWRCYKWILIPGWDVLPSCPWYASTAQRGLRLSHCHPGPATLTSNSSPTAPSDGCREGDCQEAHIRKQSGSRDIWLQDWTGQEQSCWRWDKVPHGSWHGIALSASPAATHINARTEAETWIQ